MNIKFDVLENFRDPDGIKFRTENVCSRCGNKTITYLKVNENMLLCKNCLIVGIGMIDSTILNECAKGKRIDI